MGDQSWFQEKIHECNETNKDISIMDVSFAVGTEENGSKETVSATLSFMPLESQDQMAGQISNQTILVL